MFVDFAVVTMLITHPEMGELWDAQIVVSVPRASGYPG